MKWCAVFALATAACGRWAFDPATTRDAAGAPDAIADAPPCTSFGPFSAPVLVENVNAFGPGVDDWMPTMTADDLTMYFYSYRASPGSPDIWRATRPTPSDPFSAPQIVAEVSSNSTDWSPHLTADQLRIMFTSQRGGSAGGFDVFEATRASKAMPFGVPAPVMSSAVLLPVNDTSGEEALWLSADGLRIIFESNRNATFDLLQAERPDLGSPFGPVQLVPNINDGAADDNTPGLSSDELEIFFSSNRAGGSGGYDIWRAVRASRTDPIGTPQRVAELSSPGDDYGPSLSWDGTHLYFAYNASVSGAGDADIYVAIRGCQ